MGLPDHRNVYIFPDLHGDREILVGCGRLSARGVSHDKVLGTM